jgi:hypothetical protein
VEGEMTSEYTDKHIERERAAADDFGKLMSLFDSPVVWAGKGCFTAAKHGVWSTAPTLYEALTGLREKLRAAKEQP